MLAALADELAGEGSVISPHVRPPRGRAALGALAAAGPLTAGEPAYAAIVEAVREGYLLHYERPRILEVPDEDLELLAGDYMYAKGLERLAALGDLPAVRELADLIAGSAQLHADGDPPRAAVAAIWLASAVAIAVGPSQRHEDGKRALRAGGDPESLLASTRDAAAAAGLDEQLAAAAETVGLSPFNLG